MFSLSLPLPLSLALPFAFSTTCRWRREAWAAGVGGATIQAPVGRMVVVEIFGIEGVATFIRVGVEGFKRE
jgi:hypothetical protein